MKRNKNIVYKSIADGIEATNLEDLVDKWVYDNAFLFHELGTGKISLRYNSNELPILRISKTLVTTVSVIDNTMATRLDNVGDISYLRPTIAGLFPIVHLDPTINRGKNVRYIDQTSVTRNAAAVVEAAQYPESAVEWQEKLLLLQKVGDSIPVAKEAFLDLDVIRKNIMDLLTLNITLKEDDYLYDADGVATTITGVYTKAPALVLGAYEDTVDNANLWDLLSVMRTIIMKDRRFIPDFVIINPDDALKHKLTKASDGHYVLPSILKEKGLDGMTIVESSQVTANTLVVGDSRYGTVFDHETEIAAGFVDAGFTSDILTILATKFTNILIRDVEQNAFLKCTDVTAAIAALETP